MPFHLLVCATLLSLISTAAFAQMRGQDKNCRNDRYVFCPDCSVDIRVFTKPGGLCHFSFVMSGNERVISQTVVKRPKIGIYGVAHETLGALQVSNAASGRDTFQVDVIWERNGRKLTSSLMFHVSVEPR